MPKDQWYGLTTDLRGYVIEIRLVKNNLKGTFPVEIGRFKELEVLNLDGNNLSGEILESTLNNLEQLEVLSLRENEFSGDIPFRVFTLLPRIREIWLSQNALSGEIHKNICNIKCLTHFDVYHNLLTGSIPAEIGKCEKLEVFSAGHNKLTGEIPDDMRGCHRLTYLSLYNNKLQGRVPMWIQELRGLLELNLNFNEFTGYVPRSAKEMYEKKERRLKRAIELTNKHRAVTREQSRQYEERKQHIAEEQEREHVALQERRELVKAEHALSEAKLGVHPGQIDQKIDEERKRLRTSMETKAARRAIELDLIRNEVNTARSTDEGYQYIRQVSRTQQQMGADGLGLNQPPPDPTVPQYIKDQGVVMENWRTGSRHRKMATLLGGAREIRMQIESTLPPAERKPQERRLRKETREKEEKEAFEAAEAKRIAAEEAEFKKSFGTTAGFHPKNVHTTVSRDSDAGINITYHTTRPGNTHVNNYNTTVDLTTGRNTWEPSSPTLPYLSRPYVSGDALRGTPPKEAEYVKQPELKLRSRFSKKRLHALTNSHKLGTNDGNPFKDKSLLRSPPLTPASLAQAAGSQSESMSLRRLDGMSDDGYTYASNDTNDTGMLLEASHKVNTDVVDKMKYRW